MNGKEYSPSSVSDIAEAITLALKEEDTELALRLFIQLSDNLVKVGIERLFAMLAKPPLDTGDLGWDYAIKALVEYRLRIREIPVPAWANPISPPLSKPWLLPSQYKIPVDIASVPKEFLYRGVLIEASTLESV